VFLHDVYAGPAFAHGTTGAKRTVGAPAREALQYCDSNEFIELTVGTPRVLMSKAATNNICSNKHKALREYTYVNIRIGKSQYNQIKKNPLRLFSFANEEITIL
jgi:hypothetical protein